MIFWSLKASLRKKILHLVSSHNTMLNFGPFFNLNCFMACLAYENFAFCDLRMPNFWTYFSLNVWVYDCRGCMAPSVRKFYIDELKVPNFRPFSLNDFWVMQGSNPLASKKILHLVISKCLVLQALFQPKFISMILGFACPLPKKNLRFIFVR